MRKIIATLATGVAMMGVGVMPADAAQTWTVGQVSKALGSKAGRASLARAFPECRYEDGSGQRACLWTPNKHGNRRGKAYLTYQSGRARVYVYRGSWLLEQDGRVYTGRL